MQAGAPVYAIVGGSGGIGSALARRLAAGGARVVLASRDAERAQALAAELGALGLAADATRLEDLSRLLETAIETHGRLDGVVNCAGSFLLKPAHATSDADWDETIAANLTTAFNVVRAAVKILREGGSIVLVASAAARTGFANHDAIAAAKAGVVGLTYSAAATYAPRGIRVNAVAPGLVRSPGNERIWSGPSGEAARAMHPLGRLGEPEDVASAIAWLLDPEQSWVSGQVLGVDGGIATARARG
ncbi:MAG: short-chain dehydrogenase [Gaiellaceae bacterium]|jgi:NAD(P)-dependent dehydrogenase (short-subunit alcohol dehydrogenase family)|nr:MAG: short-chain dehydrogenase [Gaiellaceae bacterium]